jgi:hypothetical protein
MRRRTRSKGKVRELAAKPEAQPHSRLCHVLSRALLGPSPGSSSSLLLLPGSELLLCLLLLLLLCKPLLLLGVLLVAGGAECDVLVLVLLL